LHPYATESVEILVMFRQLSYLDTDPCLAGNGEGWGNAAYLSVAADKNILYLSCLLSRFERQTNRQTN